MPAFAGMTGRSGGLFVIPAKAGIHTRNPRVDCFANNDAMD